ncbi:site-2 protease family protein [Gloeothece verrucosa]|uniref:Peptidase M50 n=1 Tax=Gloeothece verrucosa (strain PCC 7822) TaxID=497965 RepID=E0U6G1_GLOV7|nr:site-2 protease family protein [Gloeothece verrucosa]ADN13604.1 peptidase M50 [Gloeothece verrucosa PCC 7822]
MEIWLLLIIIGFITYYLLQRHVAKITQTPIWLIWLVMMIFPIIWGIWWQVYGEDKPIPPLLLFGPFILCPLLYSWLIQIGRPKTGANETNTEITPNNEPTPPPANTPTVRPITVDEEKELRDCFPWGVYYLQQIDYRPQAILCRGKLRAVPEVAYKTIKENVEKVFDDRFIVLFQESLQGQPFFALVANPWSKTNQPLDSQPLNRPLFALSLLLITLFTTTVIGTEISGVTPQQLEANHSLILQGLPYSLGLITILGIHEFSHYLAAVYYKIKATLPYFIPIPFFLGTFGAFIQMKSPVPHRRALFDVAIAGPLGGFLVTLPLLLWGLTLSQTAQINPENTSLLNFKALDPRFSLLFAVLSKIALGNQLSEGVAIALHPLAVAGYIGLIVTALNLMPVGQLDGGHIVHAMFGQKTGIIIGQLTRLLVFVLAMIKSEFLLWAIILLFMPLVDNPALNDVTELDNKRDFLGLFSLALLISILLPVPAAIAQWLSL